MPVVAAVAVTNLESLPLILTLKELALIYRVSMSTIRRGLQNGTFRPRPFEKYPYRWKRDDVAADLRRPRDEQPRRAHGFASRVRPVKMKLPPTPTNRAAK
jgi:hypothetical protein